MKNCFLLFVTFSTLLLSSCDGVDCTLVDCPLYGARVQFTFNSSSTGTSIDINDVTISSSDTDLLPEINPLDIENTIEVLFKAEGTYQLVLGDRLTNIEISWTEVVGDCCTVTDLQSLTANGLELCTGDCTGPFTITL